MNAAHQMAPIALFCYRRPEHLKRTIQSLRRCVGFDQSPLYVFCDGPRNDADRGAVEETRRIARSMLGSSTTFVESAGNQGLANSIIGGLNLVFAQFDRVIVIEDDLALSSGFLRFCNQGLDRYMHDDNVFQISGYMFPIETVGLGGNSGASFLPFPSSWGWATWKRAWQMADWNANGWEKTLRDKNQRRIFDLEDSYDYSTMLRAQMLGMIDSWAIRWYFSIFVRNGLVLYPHNSLVTNTGFDGSGSHGAIHAQKIASNVATCNDSEFVLPDIIRTNDYVFSQVRKLLRTSRNGLLVRLWRSKVGLSLRRMFRV